MRTIFLPSVIALVLATGAGAPPADAQTPVCPPGYYFASDGQCYPGAPPVYPPPVYEVAPPVYQPPFVVDGLALDAYKAAAEQCRGNMRQLLGRVESGVIQDDAAEREGWQRELAMLASTKGDRAEARRADLRTKLGL